MLKCVSNIKLSGYHLQTSKAEDLLSAQAQNGLIHDFWALNNGANTSELVTTNRNHLNTLLP